MEDNRDLDEMLASLDALLREGDTHNDDMPDEAVREMEHAEQELMSDSDEPVDNTQVGDEEEPEELLAVGESMEVAPVEQTQDGTARVVLTESMMVENPQVSLPLVTPEQEVVDNEPEEQFVKAEDDSLAEPVAMDEDMVTEPVLDKESVEQLVTDVSHDVLEQLHTLLPKLIEQSLHRHLSAVQNDK